MKNYNSREGSLLQLKKQNYRQIIYASYVSKKTKQIEMTHTSEEYRQWAKAAQHRLKGWLPADKNIPILDMGCGAGHFLFLLKQLGYTDITGVDSSIEQVTLARQWCPGTKIIHGDVREVLTGNTGHFGLITGFDIIEHFRKDEILPLLEQVVQALNPGGRLILQTPNADSPLMGSIAYGDFTHEWFFSPSSLSDMLRLVGLSSYEARHGGPYIHGVISLLRSIIWFFFTLLLRIVFVAETGGSGNRIFTRVFLATAVKE